jgi:hypothetical protein
MIFEGMPQGALVLGEHAEEAMSHSATALAFVPEK